MSERHAIAGSFSRAAASYDAHAALQLSVAKTLLDLVPEDLPVQTAVDLGAGTAPLARRQQARFPDARWLMLDIAEPMLREARQRGRLDHHSHAVCADAMALPLADRSVDLLFSSFALQWCSPLADLLRELDRVMPPGATLALSVPLAGTLAELQRAWAQVDQGRHVNSLASAEDWHGAISGAGFSLVNAEQVQIRQHYPDLRSIAAMLRATGAHHVTGRSAAGLTGRRKMAALVRAYDAMREAEGLPVTWQVLYLLARKN